MVEHYEVIGNDYSDYYTDFYIEPESVAELVSGVFAMDFKDAIIESAVFGKDLTEHFIPDALYLIFRNLDGTSPFQLIYKKQGVIDKIIQDFRISSSKIFVKENVLGEFQRGKPVAFAKLTRN